MTDGISLGNATLGLEANLQQLRGDLDDAKGKVAAAVAEMQALLDRLHVGLDGGLLGAGLDTHAGAIGLWSAAQDAEMANVRRSAAETTAAYAEMAAGAEVAADLQVAASGRVVEAYAAQAAAAKAAADAEEAAAGRSALARSILGGIGGHGAIRDVAAASAIWGVRGPTPPPFSITNPGVVVVEAASRTPLGSLAAAIGEDAQGGGPEAVSVSTERANTRTVVGTTPDTQQARQRAAAPVLLGLDAQRQQVMESSLARALTALEAAQRPSVTDKTTTIAGISADDKKVAEATGAAIGDALAADATAKAALPSNVAPGQFASAALADLYAAKGLQAALGPDLRMRVYGEGGVPGTHTFGVVPGAAVGGAAGTGGPGGSGGGGGFPSWLTALLWGRAGGGGGGGGRLPGYGGALLAGAGGIGAGIGSLGSFAGFGPEHIILTLGGIAGSGVAALGGGALLGAGALGKFAVGAGSDAVVGASTIADTKQLYAAYEAVNKAVRTYGAGSEQAKEKTKELDTVFAELGNTAGVKAEAGVAKAAISLNEFWDKQTSGARVQGSKIAMQLLELDKAYIPLVAHAAEQNFSVINRTIKPLLAWLKGPEGMGIFLQLENEFKNEIPTAMAALTQGFEFFAKTVAYTAPLTGGFLRDLDKFFTKWNTPSEFAVWEGEMNKLITDFDVWKAFIKELGGALVDLFDKDAHTGEGIIETLTEMLHKVREYEKSVAGGQAISNIFTVHKAEVIALLKALVPLISSFSHIYTTVSPPLVAAVTNIAEAFTKVLTAIEKTGALGTWVIGLTLIAAKLKVLVPLLKAAGVETGILTAAEDKNAAAGGLDAGAQGALAASEGGVGAGGLAGSAGTLGEGADFTSAEGMEALGVGGLGSSLLSGDLGSTLLKGGIYGVGGLVAGSVVSSAVGAKGTLASALGDAGAGAGVGFAVGGPLGAGIGALIGGGAPYLAKGISDLFSSGQPAFKKESEKTAKEYGSYSIALLGHSTRGAAITKDLNAARERPSGSMRSLVAEVQPGAVKARYETETRKAGEEAGKEYVEAFQHVRFPSRLGVLTSMEQQLAKLPAAARTSAAKTMLEYAQKLESEGRLPQGVIAGFVTALEGKVSGLTGFLIKEGAGSAHALQKSYELTQARSTLKNSLVSVEQLFGVSFKDTTTGTEEALHFLNEVVKNNKGPMGQAAQEMASGLKTGLEVEWIAAKEKNQKEIHSLNNELKTEIKQLGGSEIQAGLGVHTKPGSPVESKGINLGSEPTPFGKAQGGLLQIGQPGDAGHDTVGLNVGGLPIAVGPGEQVAVFNRHQQPIVNAALEHMGYGGLPGLFGAVTTPNYMAAGGLIPEVVQAGLRDVRGDAKAKLARMSSGAHGGGGAPSGASHTSMPYLEHLWIQAGGPPGVAHLMAAIAMAESGGDPAAENPSGASGLWQILGLPFPGNPFNPLENAKMAVSKYNSQGLGAWVTYTSGAYRSYYAQGGLLGFTAGGAVPGFAAGGHFSTGAPKKAKHLPQPVDAWKVHPFKKIKPLATTWWGQGFYDQLNGLLGETGDVAKLTEQYELSSNAAELALQAAPHGGEFIYTPGESGGGYYSAYTGPTSNLANTSSSSSGGSPEILWGNVELRQHQLEGLIGTENSLLADLNTAWGLSSTVLRAAEEGSKERAKAILSLKAKIQANLAKIKRLHEHRHALEVKLAKVPTGKKATAADHAEAKKLSGEINSTAQQIKSLEAENVQLGGNATSIGNAGQIGTLDTQVSELNAAKETVKGDQHTLGGLTEHGGSMLTAQLTLQKLGAELTAIGGPALELKLAEAKGGGTGESPLELKERELVQTEEKNKLLREELHISNNALSVFNGSGDIGRGGINAYAAAGARGMLIPASWIPSFDVGGVVAGPVGAPQLAVVHGGEQVLTPEQQGGMHFHQHNHIETLTPADPDMLLAIGKAATRGQRLQGNRLAKRLVPGI